MPTKSTFHFRFLVGTIALIGSILSSPVFADSYVCKPTAATGFAYNAYKNSWESGPITPPSSKYEIKPNQHGEGLYVWPNSKSDVLFSLEEDRSGGGILNFSGFGIFSLNVKTLRYIRTTTGGYVSDGPNGLPEGSATPFLEIGNCKRI